MPESLIEVLGARRRQELIIYCRVRDDRLRKETTKGFQNEIKDSFLMKSDEELVKKSREDRR